MAIDINPKALLNAADGLDRYIAPELESAASRLTTAYPIAFPGFGVLMLPIEAYYNEVCQYHAENLKAGKAAVEAVAGGLRRTVRNYEHAEQVHVEMFLAKPTAADEVTYTEGLAATSFANGGNMAGQNGLETTATVVEYATMAACMMMAMGCAALAPPYAVVPLTAAGLMANLPSMLSAARDISQIASELNSGTIAQLRDYLSIPGWFDSSVVAFKQVANEVIGELTQAAACLQAVADFLMAVALVISGFWVAFVSFTPVFLVQLGTVTATGVGAAVAQAIGAAAAAIWMTSVIGVFAMVGGMLAALANLVREMVPLVKMDNSDSTPDLKQVKIAWSS